MNKQPKLKIGDQVKVKVSMSNMGTPLNLKKIYTISEFHPKNEVLIEDNFSNYFVNKEDLIVIKPKTKKVKKWTHTRKELSKMINLMIESNVERIDKTDILLLNHSLLATQTQAIKEEYKHQFQGNCIRKCIKCGKTEGLELEIPRIFNIPRNCNNTKCVHYPEDKDCDFCIVNKNNPKQEESKDIEKLEFNTELVNMYPVSFMEQLWKKQCEVIATLNSLNRR